MDAIPETENSDDSASDGEPSRTCSDIIIEDDRWSSLAGFEGLIPRLVEDTLREVKLEPETRSVSIALLSDRAVQALNKSFRGKDTPTNVLSFPSPSPVGVPETGEPVFLGDIALAYETVMTEASAQGKTPLQHAAHLVVHGVLHLAGYDHEGDDDAESMEATETAILAHFGIPDPYRDDAVSSAKT